MRKIFKMGMALFVLVSFLALPVISLAEDYTTAEKVKRKRRKKQKKRLKKQRKRKRSKWKRWW